MHEFIHISPMIREEKETFNTFVKEMVEKAEDFKDFLKLFGNKNEFVKISFYELDSDEYQYPAFKWRVMYESFEENQLEFSGYYAESLFQMIKKETNEDIFLGNVVEINDYINGEEYGHLTQEEFQKEFEVKEIKDFDKCKEWLDEINGYKLVFKPEEV